jgi:hypothetical protein
MTPASHRSGAGAEAFARFEFHVALSRTRGEDTSAAAVRRRHFTGQYRSLRF